MTGIDRISVWEKYNKHCAYCGKLINFKVMQVDHIIPKKRFDKLAYTIKFKYPVDDIENLNPSCRRCNHYKRSYTLDEYRALLKTIDQRLMKSYIFKVALDYVIIDIKPWPGKFYFEKRIRDT